MMHAKRLSHIVFAGLAILLLGSAAALAAPPVVPVQTPLSPGKIPQFAQPIDLISNGGVPASLYPAAQNLSICEYATDILPPGTPLVAPATPPAGFVLGKTYVWGYLQGEVCPTDNVGNPIPLPAPIPPPLGPLARPATGRLASYLGPVVVAERGFPTAMTFINQLPDAGLANVKAYTTSTDQTLIWGDPLGLRAAPLTAFSGIVEGNQCWIEAQLFAPPALMPASCLNNYGFSAPQVGGVVPQTYLAPIPAAVHIHGGEVPSVLDGGPDEWFTPNGIYGHGYYTRHVKNLPVFLANLPASPVATLPALPDPLYPVGSIVFAQNMAGYFSNALVVDPMMVNVETWVAAAAPYAVDTLVQVVGQVYVIGPATMQAQNAAPFTDGQLVYNEADGQYNLLTAGAWGVAPVDRATYAYPNGQEAAPVWFHDHMLGATRLNVYAGIAGGYVITEPPSTLAPGLHPLGLSDRTWVPILGQTQDDRPPTMLVEPLIVQDRMFDTNGQLFFPNVGINPDHPYWVPEFVGDTILVNGKAWPFMSVEPRRYKFIFLNGSNARAYEMFFSPGPQFAVVGNDQGYLNSVNVVPMLAMMPGERYEAILDFTAFAGKSLVLQNRARTPYVGGAPVNGKTTGRIMQFRVAAAVITPDNSFIPTQGALIRSTPMNRLTVAGGIAPAGNVKIDKVRRLTLNEVIGPGGPLEVLVNNTLYEGSNPKRAALPPRSDFTPITSIWNTSYYSELPYEGETELWEIINLTADAHPMHPHLVAFNVLNRTPLDVKAYTAFYNAQYLAAALPIDGAGPPYNYNQSGNTACSPTNPVRGAVSYAATAFDPLTGSVVAPCYLGGNPDPGPLGALALIGPPAPPLPQEVGWKDTVQALPNTVTRVLVRFGQPDIPAGTASDAVGYHFSPNGGHGYVWHCHIVDHEDNEMMRPFTVYNGPYQETYLKGIHY